MKIKEILISRIIWIKSRTFYHMTERLLKIINNMYTFSLQNSVKRYYDPFPFFLLLFLPFSSFPFLLFSPSFPSLPFFHLSFLLRRKWVRLVVGLGLRFCDYKSNSQIMVICVDRGYGKIFSQKTNYSELPRSG